MKKTTFCILLGIVLPIVIGSMIYMLFRRHTIVFFSWMSSIGIGNVFDSQAIIAAMPQNPLMNWFVFSMPDGLWVFAFANALLLIWKDADRKWKYFILAVLSFIIVGHEIGQALGLFSGTFDILDIMTCLLALLFSTLINSYAGGRLNDKGIKVH